MIELLLSIIGYIKIFIIFTLLTYMYKYFFNKCNEKKIINTKSIIHFTKYFF